MANIDIRNGKFGKIIFDKNGNEVNFVIYADAAIITEKRKNIETNQYSYKLETNINGRKRETVVSFEELADKQVLMKKVFSIGCIFNHNHFEAFFESLLLQMNDPAHFPIIQVFEFSNPGWMLVPDTDILVYRSDKLIAKKTYLSEYKGRYALSPGGSFEIWADMVNSQIVGYTTLELVMLAAMSAIVIGLLTLVMPTQNIVVSIAGNTTSGKTTILHACSSVYTKVMDSPTRINGEIKRSSYGSWNTTDNGFVQQLAGNYGMALCIDEKGINNSSSVGSLLYAVANASTKLRNSSIYDTEQAESFGTSVISAGEVGLLADTEQRMSGLDIRCVEVTEKLTETAEQADYIKEVCANNHGWAKDIMAQYIVDMGGTSYIKESFEKWRKIAEFAMPLNNLSKRFSRAFVSPLMVTAEVAEKSLGIKFNKTKVLKYLAEYCKKFEENQCESDAYRDAIDVCKMNAHRFLKDNIKTSFSETWGRYFDVSYTTNNGDVVIGEFALYKTAMDEVFKEIKRKNPTTCLKKWREAGLIDCDTGHLTNKRTITKGSERVYVLRIFASKNASVNSNQSGFDVTMLQDDAFEERFDNCIVNFEEGTIVESETSCDEGVELVAESLETKPRTNREILLCDDECDDDDEFFFLIDPETGEVIEDA